MTVLKDGETCEYCGSLDLRIKGTDGKHLRVKCQVCGWEQQGIEDPRFMPHTDLKELQHKRRQQVAAA